LDEVVHIKLIDFNGEIRGMSPLKALTYEIATMFMLKDNIIAKIQNGGSPSYIISLKNGTGMGVNKSRFERLRTALESFSHLRKSHGNMPIDAEVNVHELGTNLKDMEYRELAMFVISEFALALGIPTSRVPFLMTGSGGSSNKGELSGNSEDSYQTKINSRRKQWEQAWNKVFRKAGFTFKFRRDNLQDDVRETQALNQNATYVSAVQNSLLKDGKKLKTSTLLAMLSGKKLNITEDDIEELSDDEKMMGQPNYMGMGMNKGMPAGKGGMAQPSRTQLASKVTQDKSAAKEKTADNKGRNS
jgi:phage portal protein BeeE